MNKALIYLIERQLRTIGTVITNKPYWLKPNDAQAYYNLAVLAARAKEENRISRNTSAASQTRTKIHCQSHRRSRIPVLLKTSPVFPRCA
jgi:hypothetical protein